MDKEEARPLLATEISAWRSRSYADLVGQMKEPSAFEVEGASGAKYQVEIEVFWDDKPGGNIRVICSIDDGGWRAFSPLSDDFIMAPDGSFVDE
jgi:hypothetical protein